MEKLGNLIGFLMYVGIFILIVFLSACVPVPIKYKETVKQNTSCNQDSIESRVSLTKENSYVTYINKEY